MCLFLVDPQSLCRAPVQKVFGDHFGVEGKKIGGSFRGRDHFRVNLGIISGSGIISASGSFRGRDHFGGCTDRIGKYLKRLDELIQRDETAKLAYEEKNITRKPKRSQTTKEDYHYFASVKKFRLFSVIATVKTVTLTRRD